MKLLLIFATKPKALNFCVCPKASVAVKGGSWIHHGEHGERGETLRALRIVRGSLITCPASNVRACAATAPLSDHAVRRSAHRYVRAVQKQCREKLVNLSAPTAAMGHRDGPAGDERQADSTPRPLKFQTSGDGTETIGS